MVERETDQSSPGAPRSEARPLVFRRCVAGDDVRIVELHNRLEPGGIPLTVERFRAERLKRKDELWVALCDDDVAATADFEPAWWTGRPEVFALDLRVDPDWCRRGIGRRLHDLMEARLRMRGARRVTSWVRSDSLAGRAFAADRGLVETGQLLQDYLLVVSEANTAACESRVGSLRSRGVIISSLAELGANASALLPALHQLAIASTYAGPGLEPVVASFPTWRRQVLKGHGRSPETHWVALEGDSPVGMTYLKRLDARAAENDYTVVAAGHRGRGIAQALKLHAIDWARRSGVEWLCAASEAGNLPMIAVNLKLGYQPGIRRIEVARDLS